MRKKCAISLKCVKWNQISWFNPAACKFNPKRQNLCPINWITQTMYFLKQTSNHYNRRFCKSREYRHHTTLPETLQT